MTCLAKIETKIKASRKKSEKSKSRETKVGAMIEKEINMARE